MRSYAKSLELFARAAKVTPGAAQTASKAPGRVGPIGAFPLFLDRGEGPMVWDVDGNDYVDWFNGNCAVTLGHANHLVESSVAHALRRRGALISLPTDIEVNVAERLVAQIPCAEQVRFLKTGSEATEAAVRIARMATGRSVVLVERGAYHGWHSWSTSLKDYKPGVPSAFGGMVRELIIDAAGVSPIGRDVAAVIVEPNRVPPKMLPALVGCARQAGALVIFDEMICGNRWHVGGYQAHVGLTPDLATFGKAYANGHPLAFVCGPADLMRHAWVVSGTFGGETSALAACDEVLRLYGGGFTIGRMWAVGQMLIDAFNGAATRLGVPAVMGGAPCRPVVTWSTQDNDLAVALFQQELAESGILAHPSGWNPSEAHHPVAMDITMRGVAQALLAVADYLSRPFPEQYLRGERLRPPFARPA